MGFFDSVVKGPVNDKAYVESLIDMDATRDGRPKFLFVIRTHIIYQPGGYYDDNAGIPLVDHDAWECEEWSDGDKDDFKDGFRDYVQDAFGYGRFWLNHTNDDYRGFWCDVWLDFTKRESAHLIIRALKNPHRYGSGAKGFRANCALGGQIALAGKAVDMTLKLESVVKETPRTLNTSDRGSQTFKQRACVHEFGHYLGLDHRCSSMAPWNWNSDVEYCSEKSYAEQDDLMAVGNTLSAKHGQPFANRLATAHGFLGYKVWPNLASDRHTCPW